MVSVDARVPGKLVYEALLRGALPHFKGYSSIYREATLGQSRLDFLISSSSRFCFLEVKSVTLVRQGRALFPDAPTLRGMRQPSSSSSSERTPSPSPPTMRWIPNLGETSERPRRRGSPSMPIALA
ncbi:MAG: hypothetical protein E3J65_03190 [Dehalococcoidia bacterium]|nr:MAG: hypothetical protein E3J65_03190 [Dehalococcoidia bacterium]